MAQMTAAEMGRKRWAGIDAKARTRAARKAAAARMTKLSPAKRKRIATVASRAAAKQRSEAARQRAASAKPGK